MQTVAALFFLFRASSLIARIKLRPEVLCREFGLSYLLSQRNNFRHFLEEPVSTRDGALVIFWPGHTRQTPLAPKCCSEARQEAPQL
jgi:hypothetical protein